VQIAPPSSPADTVFPRGCGRHRLLGYCGCDGGLPPPRLSNSGKNHTALGRPAIQRRTNECDRSIYPHLVANIKGQNGCEPNWTRAAHVLGGLANCLRRDSRTHLLCSESQGPVNSSRNGVGRSRILPVSVRRPVLQGSGSQAKHVGCPQSGSKKGSIVNTLLSSGRLHL
jgi:hypothetical protein